MCNSPSLRAKIVTQHKGLRVTHWLWAQNVKWKKLLHVTNTRSNFVCVVFCTTARAAIHMEHSIESESRLIFWRTLTWEFNVRKRSYDRRRHDMNCLFHKASAFTSEIRTPPLISTELLDLLIREISTLWHTRLLRSLICATFCVHWKDGMLHSACMQNTKQSRDMCFFVWG